MVNFFQIFIRNFLGFGDITPQKFELSLVYFFFIIVGMSFFSMCIHIAQDMMDNLTLHIGLLIANEYQNAMVKGESLADTDVEAGDAKMMIKKRLESQPGGKFLSRFISTNAKKQLQDQWEEKAKLRSKEVQTDRNLVDAEVQVEASMTGQGVSMGVQTLKTIPIMSEKRWKQWNFYFSFNRD